MAEAAAPTRLNTEEAVKEYYGKVLSNSNDLKTNACTTQPRKYPKFIRDAMSMIHEEVTAK